MVKISDLLTHLQENYVHIMTHKTLDREKTTKKNIYLPRDPISSIYASVKELMEFSNITGTTYTHIQAINISYLILHCTGNINKTIW